MLQELRWQGKLKNKVTIRSRNGSSPCVFFFCRVAALRWQPITSVEIVKFVARQVEASVVIRATKLKFVAESRTRVYFSQHVTSTCNIVFCCETSWPRRWKYAQQSVNLHCNNVARQVEEKCCPYYRTFKYLPQYWSDGKVGWWWTCPSCCTLQIGAIPIKFFRRCHKMQPGWRRNMTVC